MFALLKDLKLVYLVVFWGIMISDCSAQSSSYNYKGIPRSYLPIESSLKSLRERASQLQQNNHDLTNDLPNNFVKDGSVDYTTYLQSGINKYDNVIFPNFPVLINQGGLDLKSNSVVIFGSNSKLIMKPNELGANQMIRIFNVQNLKLYFPVLEGDRNSHLGKAGEWGMGISIAGSSNIDIINPKIKNCWGDGIYLGKINETINSNINIYYAQLDNNRRNGISIVCVNGLNLKNPVITNTNGTLPMSGIDIEPNGNSDIIDNIIIDNPITFNNSSYGILFALERFYGKKAKSINIKVNNHIDDNSNCGLGLSLADLKLAKTVTPNYSGAISIINPVWKNNKKGAFTNYQTFKNGLKVNFENVKVMKKDANGKEIVDTKNLLGAKKIIQQEYNEIIK